MVIKLATLECLMVVDEPARSRLSRKAPIHALSGFDFEKCGRLATVSAIKHDKFYFYH